MQRDSPELLHIRDSTASFVKDLNTSFGYPFFTDCFKAIVDAFCFARAGSQAQIAGGAKPPRSSLSGCPPGAAAPLATHFSYCPQGLLDGGLEFFYYRV